MGNCRGLDKVRIYYVVSIPAVRHLTPMKPSPDDGNPRFGRLLIVLVAAVLFCGLLTWLMGEVFPNFPGF